MNPKIDPIYKMPFSFYLTQKIEAWTRFKREYQAADKVHYAYEAAKVVHELWAYKIHWEESVTALRGLKVGSN